MEPSPPLSAKATILRATLRVIADGGIDAVRYRAVANIAQLSVGSVSYHYPSRQELIREAAEFYFQDSLEVLQSLRAGFPSRTVQDVARFLVEVVRQDLSSPERTLHAEYELVLYAARDPEVAKALHRYEQMIIAQLAEVLEGLNVQPAFAIARLLTNIVRGHELLALSHAPSALATLEATIERVLTALLAPHNHQLLGYNDENKQLQDR